MIPTKVLNLRQGLPPNGINALLPGLTCGWCQLVIEFHYRTLFGSPPVKCCQDFTAEAEYTEVFVFFLGVPLG